MNKKHEKMWKEYVDSSLEISVKKKEGQDGCSIFVVGSNHHMLIALTSLIDKLLRAKAVTPGQLQDVLDIAVKHLGESNESK